MQNGRSKTLSRIHFRFRVSRITFATLPDRQDKIQYAVLERGFATSEASGRPGYINTACRYAGFITDLARSISGLPEFGRNLQSRSSPFSESARPVERQQCGADESVPWQARALRRASRARPQRALCARRFELSIRPPRSDPTSAAPSLANSAPGVYSTK